MKISELTKDHLGKKFTYNGHVYEILSPFSDEDNGSGIFDEYERVLVEVDGTGIICHVFGDWDVELIGKEQIMEQPIIKTIQNIRTEIRELKGHYDNGDLFERETNLLRSFNEQDVLIAYNCEDREDLHDNVYNYWRN